MPKLPRPKDNITTLRAKIDYDDRTEPRFSSLNKALKLCPSRFRTSSGIPGVDLYKWRDRAHQAGLDEMTRDFLDIQGFGFQFWPDTPSSPFYNKYSYTTHKDHIHDVVKNLLFLLIAQSHRSRKNAYRKVDGKAQPSRDPGNSPRANNGPSRSSTPDTSNMTSTNRPHHDIDPPTQADLGTEDQRHLDSNLPEVSSAPARDGPVNRMPHLHPRSPNTTRTKRGRQNESTTDSNKRTKRLNRPHIPGERFTNRVSKPTQKLGSLVGNAALDLLARYEEDSSFTAVNHRRQRPNNTGDENGAPEADVWNVPVDENLPSPIDPRLIDLTVESSVDGSVATDRAFSHGMGPTPSVEPPDDPLVETPREPSIEQSVQLPIEPARQPFIEQPAPPPPEAPRQPPTQPIEEVLDKPERPQLDRNDHNGPAKPSITFIYRVQLSPLRGSKRWYPEGRFQDKRLSELFRELNFESDVQGLVFSISGSEIPMMERVLRDDEDGFVSIKREVHRKIRRWASCQRQLGGSEDQAPHLLVEILIEPITGDPAQPLEEMEDLEDLELNW